MVMGCRVRSKSEMVFFRGMAQIVENSAGLNTPELSFEIDVEHLVQVFRHIDNDRRVAALTSQAGSAAATGDRRAIVASHRNGRDDVVNEFGA